ncbi:MAG: hypothetical protein JJU28_07500 [Cyclobacteriaceae bacterium]|nr:hypothetical protein [Cyclobacteriaceae bacterium]
MKKPISSIPFISLTRPIILLIMTFAFYQCTQPEGKPLENYSEYINKLEYAHPLDPLDSMEIALVKQHLSSKLAMGEWHYYSFITLKEPPKSEVLSFEKGQPFRREALASIYNYADNILFEVVLDLKGKKIVQIDTLKDQQPVGNFKADSATLDQIMTSSQEWIDALAKRGISIDSVNHSGNAAADMGLGPKGSREQIVSPKYKNKKYRMGITGLFAYVDLTEKKILKIVEEDFGITDPVEVNYFNGDSAQVTIQDTKPLNIAQPEGTTFNVYGHEVIWNNWKFRYGVSNREGLVIYQASYNDQGNWRSVMYRGSMAEMVVNYGSPDLVNASYNFFDVGVYRLGQNRARPMMPGSDAPENAVYLPAVFHNDTAKVIPFDNAVAIYEEYGGPLWRHGKHAKRATNLVVKYYTTIGNYDYAFKWIFKQDGTIEVATELTGIVHIRAVNRTNDLPGWNDEMYQKQYYYGTLVHEHVEAGNHQHFFVYRMDMDVDGTGNTAGEMNAMSLPRSKENPYSNSIVNEMQYFKTEKEAQRRINAASSRHWKVMNHNKQNKWGHHSAYVLMPGAGVIPLVGEGSSLLNRAGFLNNHFWATKYSDDEIYPAGPYPASNQKNAGLPTWTAADRDIENEDIVIWYVAGVTHMVRPEEWPIMNVHEMKFEWMPYGFFSNNPVVKMPDKNKEQTTASNFPKLDDDITNCDSVTGLNESSDVAKLRGN